MAVPSSPRAALASPRRSQRQRQEPQASVSVFFLFLPVATVVLGPLKSCPGVILGPAALAYLPGNKPTPRTPRQSIYARLRFALFDGGSPACGVFRQCCRCWRAAGLSMFFVAAARLGQSCGAGAPATRSPAVAPGELVSLWLDAQQLRVLSDLARRDRKSGGTGAREMW
jgi:hypothetical protein